MAKVTVLVHQRMSWLALALKAQVEDLNVQQSITLVLDMPLGFAFDVLELLEPSYAVLTSCASPYYLAHLAEYNPAAILIEPLADSTLVSAVKVLGAGERIPFKLEPSNLTAREQHILRLLARGKNDKQIAAILKLQVKTIHSSIQSLYKKLNAHNPTDLSAKYWGEKA